MYTLKSLEAIFRHETRRFGGDSDARHDSREEFYATHRPNAPPLQPTGETIAVILWSPDENLHWFPPGTKSEEVIWEKDPETGRLAGYVPKALPVRTITAP